MGCRRVGKEGKRFSGREIRGGYGGQQLRGRRGRWEEIDVEKEEFVVKTEKIRWEEGTVCWRDLGKREVVAKKRREEIGGDR